MKTWLGLPIVCISMVVLAACSGQAAVPTEATDIPAQIVAANTTVVESAANTDTAISAPSPTSVPTETPTLAPTPTPDLPPLWVWAWTQDPAQIIAISTDGQTNILMDAPDPAAYNNANLWQVGPDKAIAMYVVGRKPITYLLTTTEATELVIPSVQMAVPENPWSLVAVNDPYVVIKYSYGIAEAAVLINTDTANATLIAPNVAEMSPPVHFSADGRYLRFVTTSKDTGFPSQIVERDLTTGQDRTLYAYSNFDHVYSDATGDVWLDFRTGDVIAADGRLINPQPPQNSNQSWRLVGDWIMISEYACEQVCTLTLSPIFGSEPTRTYILPEKVAGYGLTGWLLDDQSLLVFQNASTQYWRLTSDGQGQLVGNTDPFGISTTIISTDAGDPAIYDSMLDLRTGEVLPLPVASEDTVDFWIDQFPNGLIFSFFQSDSNQSAWVRTDDSLTFSELPTDANTYCYELLADSSVICQSYVSSDDQGVYRYEPATGTLTKLTDLTVYLLAAGQ